MAGLEPPPEARLIAARRQQMIPRMSQREAALRAGISSTRWRQLESGKIRVRGRDYPEIAPPDTLARMAQVVDVSPEELEEVGREDAALVLRRLMNGGRDARQVLIDDIQNATGLTAAQKREIMDLINRGR